MATQSKIKVVCPYEDCDRNFNLKADLVGKKVRCDKCKRRFIVGAEGMPSGKVDESQTTAAAGPTKNLEAQDSGSEALEPADSALEPADSEGSKDALEPAAEEAAEDLGGLSLDGGSEPETDMADQLESMGIVSAAAPPTGQLTPDTGAADAGDADTGEDEMGLSIDGGGGSQTESKPETQTSLTGYENLPGPGSSGGLNTAEEETTKDEGEMSLGDGAPTETAEEEASTAAAEPIQCSGCGGNFQPSMTACPLCGMPVGGHPKPPREPRSKKAKFGIATGVLVAAAVLIFIFWKPIKENLEKSETGKKVVTATERISQSVVDSVKETAEKAGVEVLKDKYVRVQVDDVNVLGDDGATLITVRKGQPMILLGDESGKKKVRVRTPEQNHEGFVQADQVKEDESVKQADLLGWNRPAPDTNVGYVTSMSISPNGQFMVGASMDISLKGVKIQGDVQQKFLNQGMVYIWDMAQKSIVRSWQHKGVTGAAFLPDSTVITVSMEDGARVWDPLTTGTLRTIPEMKGGTGVNPFFLHGETSAVLINAEKQVEVWDLASGAKQANSPEGAKAMILMGISNLSYVIVISPEMTRGRYSLPALEKAAKEPKTGVFSPDGKLLAAKGGKARPGSKAKAKASLYISDAVSGKTMKRIKGPASTIQPVAFLGGSRFVGALTARGKMSIFDTRIRRAVTEVDVPGEFDPMMQVCKSSPDGTVLALAKGSGGVELVAIEIPKTAPRGSAVAGDGGAPDDDPPVDEREARKLYSLFNSFLLNNLVDKAKKYHDDLVEKFPDSELTKKAKEQLAKKTKQ